MQHRPRATHKLRLAFIWCLREELMFTRLTTACRSLVGERLAAMVLMKLL